MMRKKNKGIMVVHRNWTYDGNHHVTIFGNKKPRLTTRNFKDFSKARNFAKAIARKQKIKEFPVKTSTGRVQFSKPKISRTTSRRSRGLMISDLL